MTKTKKMTWCRYCGGTGDSVDCCTSEFTPICPRCHGKGELPVGVQSPKQLSNKIEKL